MRKYLLLGFLTLLLIISFIPGALAALVTPTDGTKDSDKAQYYDIGKTNSTYADTYGATGVHDANVFYVPGNTPGSIRIHANYTVNTDACAACHFTHTATGPRLLQWDSIYEACAACHDGSLGQWTYDVFAGRIGNYNTYDSRTNGGLFGSTLDEVSAGNNYLTGGANPTSISNHMSNGYMALSAAPGALTNANEESVQFDCASCHTPHGQGGNARILNPDPGKLKIDDFFPDEANYPININGLANRSEFIEQLTTPAAGVKAYQSSSKHWIQGYPYNRITGVFASTSGEPSLKFNPYDATHKSVYSDTANVVKLVYGTDYTIKWRDGIVDIRDDFDLAGKTLYAVRVPGIFVAMSITDYLQSDEFVEYIELDVDKNGVDGASYPNQGINAYCGACHGQYNTQGHTAQKSYDFVLAGDKNHGSGQSLTYGAYRHQVGFKWVGQWTGQASYIKFAYELDKTNGKAKSEANGYNNVKKVFTCLSCHFAHGVNDQYWLDYVKSIYNGDLTKAPVGFKTLEDMKELYGSSALKRLPNMGVCESCHDKSSGNAKDTTDGGAYYY